MHDAYATEFRTTLLRRGAYVYFNPWLIQSIKDGTVKALVFSIKSGVVKEFADTEFGRSPLWASLKRAEYGEPQQLEAERGAATKEDWRIIQERFLWNEMPMIELPDQSVAELETWTIWGRTSAAGIDITRGEGYVVKVTKTISAKEWRKFRRRVVQAFWLSNPNQVVAVALALKVTV